MVVLALSDDLAALSLCDKIQDHFRLTNSLHKVRGTVQCVRAHTCICVVLVITLTRQTASINNNLLLVYMQVRFVVQMQETRWAEAFSMLDCIPTHDFVCSTKSIMLAAVTDYNKDCVLVEGCHMTGSYLSSTAFSVLCVYTSICVHVYVYVYLYVCLCVYSCRYLYLCIHLYFHSYICACIYVYVHIYIHIYRIILAYIYIYIHIYIYIIFVYVYIYNMYTCIHNTFI